MKPTPSSLLPPLLLTAAATLGFASLSIHNARAFSPTWGQDLAFFTQLVHSAATGGPWASPLLLEPQGFFEMVHTHLVLPLVVGVYALLPRQEVLLVFQALFACLGLWPAFRLGEQQAGRVGGLLAALSLLAFGPFQAVAIADFRPSALFIPGVLGMYAAAREGRAGQALLWGILANLGRQEGAYLVVLVGISLCLLPWRPTRSSPGTGEEQAVRRRRTCAVAKLGGGGWLAHQGALWWSRLALREGLLLVLLGTAILLAWLLLKPQFLFHLNPLNPAPPADLPPEMVEQRWQWLGHLVLSGAPLGLLNPAPLLAGLPVFREMASTGRDWVSLTGPGAHYGAFWLPFVWASAIAGAGRLKGRIGLGLLLVLSGLSFPWVGLREGPIHLGVLVEQVGPQERVAADYDLIHAVAGREVLWNTAQLSMKEEERPHGWQGEWPIPLDTVDVLLLKESDPLRPRAEAAGWVVQDRAGEHLLMRRP